MGGNVFRHRGRKIPAGLPGAQHLPYFGGGHHPHGIIQEDAEHPFPRQQAGLLPDLAEYSRRFCLTERHLELTHPGVKVLHPGPMNRGLEISDDVADDPRSLVLDQVASGVATRMAVLYLLATRNDGGC